ncbi:hypothetical protein AGMMS49949_04150 [Alphaproteobacteria bacterium]|nr:hypothetical protein AGMMS49949_04150 [Alphaproteobacteria bacterium]GHS97142.1 hypothetical protein AGMMS50296_3900 [Alphaproteobacteria bacterium]
MSKGKKRKIHNIKTRKKSTTYTLEKKGFFLLAKAGADMLKRLLISATKYSTSSLSVNFLALE